MTTHRESLDQSYAAQLSRLRDAALREAEVCDARELPRLAQFALGEANAFAVAISIVTGRAR